MSFPGIIVRFNESKREANMQVDANRVAIELGMNCRCEKCLDKLRLLVQATVEACGKDFDTKTQTASGPKPSSN